MSDRLWQVEAPHFVAGFTETYDGIIANAAPIIGYAINKRSAWFKNYCLSKGWKLTELSHD